MSFDPTLPYKNVDGVNVNLTSEEISSRLAAADSYATQTAIFVTQISATAALLEADKTMLRIQEGISLGLTTALATDVVAWVNYRRSLRALVKSATAESLPTKPAYPVGT